MKVYEHRIDICLSPAHDDAIERDDEVKKKLWPVRERFFTPTKGAPAGTTTQERALIRLFWGRASDEYKLARENGYVGSFHNCVFELLYGVFGADVIAYLFNQGWVPETTIAPFHPGSFLKRLSVLEETVRELKDGEKTPIHLPETTPYMVAGMGPELRCFREKKHRLLLDYSLRELRGFGDLACSRNWRGEKQIVYIQIYAPYGFNDPECRAFKLNPDDLGEEHY